MALRAYMWSMTKASARDIHGEKTVRANLAGLWMAMEMTEEELRAHDEEMMAKQIQHSKDRTLKPKVIGVMCMAPECENVSTESGTQLMRCSKCMRARYCCQACQVSHWPEHKIECKLWRGQL
mmetsp:Transcript_3477/g.8973  ORF Transcript_3477/g.8973 Transcript_3477/m.8973 type:complete len:123 (-) Transcript_3477:61-429(-)